MARSLALPCALALLCQACSCDPPAVVADDGGADLPDVANPLLDGGAPLADAGDVGDDAGQGFTLTGAALLQREDGVLVELDLETGVTSYPLGERSVRGGIAPLGDEVLTFSEDELGGRLYGWNPATGAFTPYSRVSSRPYSLATSPDAARVASLGGLGGTIYEGAVTDDELGQTGFNPVGSSMTYTEQGELVYGTESGVRLATDMADGVFFATDCAALAYLSEADGYLCGATVGSSLVRFDESGVLEVLDDTAGASYRSVTPLDDGSIVAVRRDCSLVGDADLPEALEPLCPTQVVEHQGTLYIGQEHGGLLAYDGETLLQRIGFALFAGGLASTGDRLAVGGGGMGEIGTFAAGFEEPRRSEALEGTLGLAMADDGTVLALDEEGLARIAPGEEEVSYVSSFSDGTALARVGASLLVARGELGLFSAPLAAPDELESLDTAPADLIAGCSTTAVYTSGDELRAFDEDGGDRLLLADVTGELGEVTGIGCLDDQVLLGTLDGQIWGRPITSEEPFQLAGQLAQPAWYIAAPLD